MHASSDNYTVNWWKERKDYMFMELPKAVHFQGLKIAT